MPIPAPCLPVPPMLCARQRKLVNLNVPAYRRHVAVHQDISGQRGKASARYEKGFYVRPALLYRMETCIYSWCCWCWVGCWSMRRTSVDRVARALIHVRLRSSGDQDMDPCFEMKKSRASVA